MYDPKTDSLKNPERYAKPGETLYQHLFRVHEYSRSKPDRVVFEQIPAELQREFPDVYGKIDTERLGTIVALVWSYLGGKGAVNIPVVKKWFREAVDSSR